MPQSISDPIEERDIQKLLGMLDDDRVVKKMLGKIGSGLVMNILRNEVDKNKITIEVCREKNNKEENEK